MRAKLLRDIELLRDKLRRRLKLAVRLNEAGIAIPDSWAFKLSSLVEQLLALIHSLTAGLSKEELERIDSQFSYLRKEVSDSLNKFFKEHSLSEQRLFILACAKALSFVNSFSSLVESMSSSIELHIAKKILASIVMEVKKVAPVPPVSKA